MAMAAAPYLHPKLSAIDAKLALLWRRRPTSRPLSWFHLWSLRSNCRPLIPTAHPSRAVFTSMREHDLFFYAERSPPTCTTRSTRRSLVPPSIIEHGLAFRVLTKAGTRAWCDHDLYRPDRDAFASTLTSLDDIAAWKNQDQQGPYLTVEVSPRFLPHEHRVPKPSIFDDIFDHEDE